MEIEEIQALRMIGYEIDSFDNERFPVFADEQGLCWTYDDPYDLKGNRIPPGSLCSCKPWRVML